MKKEEVIQIFKDVIKKAGYEELLTVSDNVNQLADIMIYSGSDKKDMFAMEGKPLFPFSQIDNILYDFGEDKNYYEFAGMEIKFTLELNDGSSYVIEDGEQGLLAVFYFEQERFAYYDEIQKALKKYNDKIKKKDFVLRLLYSIAEMVENRESIDDIEVSSIAKEISSYIDNNPNDSNFLYYYAYELLCLYVYNDSDLFDLDSILRIIVNKKQADGFLAYIEDYNIDSDGNISVPGYYVSLVSCALNKIKEIESENAEAVNN